MKAESFNNNREIYPSKILLATREDVLKNKPESIKMVLRSLEQAAEFYKNNKQKTYPYLSKEFGYSEEQFQIVIEKINSEVSYDASALKLVREIGKLINLSIDEFKDKQVPDYSTAFFLESPKKTTHQSSTSELEKPTPAKTEPSLGATLERTTICRPNNMVSALLYIAEAKGFLRDRGVDAKFETATNAKLCQDMLLAKRAEYMSGGDGPYTYIAASNPPLKIIAMTQRNPETSIFARKDRGISTFRDLKGKRIAYLPGTVSFFFMKKVIKKYGLESDIKLTSMQPPTMPQALIGGSIDGYAMWEPWGAQAKAALKENLVTLSDTDLYQYEGLIIGHQDALTSNPELSKKIIRALIDAEEFMKNNDQEAFEILSSLISFEKSTLKALWPKYHNRVRLDRAVIEDMKENYKLLQAEDENFKELPTPDFLKLIDDSALRAVDQTRITLGENNNQKDSSSDNKDRKEQPEEKGQLQKSQLQKSELQKAELQNAELQNVAPNKAEVTPLAKTRLCLFPSMPVSSFIIAEKKNFFKEFGIEPVFHNTTNGKICQDEIVAGHADFSFVADAPFAYLSSNSHNIKLLANFAEGAGVSLVANKLSAINEFKDIAGKRIAILPGTISSIFTYKILEKYNINKDSIKLVPLQPPAMIKAVQGRQIDGFVFWQPWINHALVELGSNGTNIKEKNIYKYQVMLISNDDTIKNNNFLISRVLKALLKSEEFINNNQEVAAELTSDYLKMDKKLILEEYKDFKFKISLSKNLIQTLDSTFLLIKKYEEEFKESKVPDFYRYIYSDTLKELRPDLVENGL